MTRTMDLNVLYFYKFPKLLERYELVKKIGKGAQATVFQCRSREGGQEFACKSIYKGPVGEFQTPARLRREIEIMTKLAGSRGIASLHDVIADRCFTHLIIELCHSSLYDRIQQHGRLSPTHSALLLKNLALAIQTLHSHGIVHRDLKPGNILLALNSPPYDIRVSDFGLSSCFSHACSPFFTARVGTRRYYAPEVLHGHYSKEVDIWGLGIILYEALTGLHAFSCLENTNEVVERLSNGEDLAASCLEWPAGVVSEEAHSLVLAMLELKPEDRISLENILSHPWVTKASCESEAVAGEDHVDHNSEELRSNTCSKQNEGECHNLRIKLQRLNGAWQVVKPCALIC